MSDEALRKLQEAHDAAAAERNGTAPSFWCAWPDFAPRHRIGFEAPADFETKEARQAAAIILNSPTARVRVTKGRRLEGLRPAGRAVHFRRTSPKAPIGAQVAIYPQWMPAKSLAL